MQRDLHSIKQAVARAFGERLLNVHKANTARGIFALEAADAGVPLVDIADALGCTHAGVVQAHMSASHALEACEREVKEAFAKVELILDEQPAIQSDGAIAPRHMRKEWWLEIAQIIGRDLSVASDGHEVEIISEAYATHCASHPVSPDFYTSIILPSDGRMLCLDFRSYAIDGYADGETPTYDVVFSAELLNEEEAS